MTFLKEHDTCFADYMCSLTGSAVVDRGVDAALRKQVVRCKKSDVKCCILVQE